MLEIEKWLVFGGSWGSTLSLAYSQTYPTSVSEMVLQRNLYAQKKRARLVLSRGASKFFQKLGKNS